jgi:NADPH:quinone reductase-like Zn-dependent oxidoreductase
MSMASESGTGLQLRSLIKRSGELELSLAKVPIPEPGPEEVVVRVEAAPINPSDLGLLLGPADLTTAKASGTSSDPIVMMAVPGSKMKAVEGRVDEPMPVGSEGAGVVIKAGAAEKSQALLDKTVGIIGGAMYAQYRCVRVSDCLVLPDGTSAAEGASSFVNPMTSLGMVETMRREGHTALVHTAAASNLGQMLNRICLKDGVGLVNIVRSRQQEELLRSAHAKHVCNSTAPTFKDDLTQALLETGATIAFDAIGGGRLASDILASMEAAITKKAKTYNRYGSTVHKQVYVYGGLDSRPIELDRTWGSAWSVGGWLLTPFLRKIGSAEVQRLRERVLAELRTTFASHYSKVVSLQEALQLQNIFAYSKRATGEKYLINPNKAA